MAAVEGKEGAVAKVLQGRWWDKVRFLHKASEKTREEWQDIIDKAYHEARALLSE